VNSTNSLEKNTLHMCAPKHTHGLSQQFYAGSVKNHSNTSDTFITSEEYSIYVNYIEIHSHEKRHRKKPERISKKEKNDRQTMAAIFMSHLRQCSVWVWRLVLYVCVRKGAAELFPVE